jgi:hypothetical protein
MPAEKVWTWLVARAPRPTSPSRRQRVSVVRAASEPRAHSRSDSIAVSRS